MNSRSRAEAIKLLALKHGFDACGISKAEKLDEEARRLEEWLDQGRNGEMSYMANHFDMRTDPTKLVPGAKSVISLQVNYFNPQKQIDAEAPKISMYAYGRDYHKVVKKQTKALLKDMQQAFGHIEGRCFVDSAPVMDKAWAAKSGLGWIGKNSNLLTKGSGSYYFLAEIICDLELEADSPVKDYCGSCTKCIDACPTDAIYEPYRVDGSKCVSYFTIELKNAKLPSSMQNKFDNWMFGCDICQEVCPINARAKPHQQAAFLPKDELLNMEKSEWEEITEEVFNQLFEGSPVKRTGFKGLKRNIQFLGIKKADEAD